MASHFSRLKERAARALKSPGSPEKKKGFPKSSSDGANSPSNPQSSSAAPPPQRPQNLERSRSPCKNDIERWTSSMTGLLGCPLGVRIFREFLEAMENESGEEGEHTKYIDFYLECEDYKEEFKRLEDRAKSIYENYLADAAGKPLGYQNQTNQKGGYMRKLLRLKAKDIADRANFLQIGADKEVGTGGKSVAIGDKLDESGLEGVTLFDEPQKKVVQRLEDNYYPNFCNTYLRSKFKV